MDASLKKILTKLNIDKTHHVYFESGKLTQLSFNKDSRLYTIKLSLDEPLPANVYVATLEAFQKHLSAKEEKVLVAMYITLNKLCNDSKIVKDYITFYIDAKVKNSEDYQFLKEQSMNIRDNEVKIIYTSTVLEECFNDLKKKLERFISASGFSHLRINPIYEEPEETNTFDYEKDIICAKEIFEKTGKKPYLRLVPFIREKELCYIAESLEKYK